MTIFLNILCTAFALIFFMCAVADEKASDKVVYSLNLFLSLAALIIINVIN